MAFGVENPAKGHHRVMDVVQLRAGLPVRLRAWARPYLFVWLPEADVRNGLAPASLRLPPHPIRKPHFLNRSCADV